MELIKEFTVGLVIVCIAGAVVIVLTPEGAMEKQVKTAVSLVMLLCFIYPFCSGIDLDFDSDLTLESDVEIVPEELLLKSIESKLISDITVYLSNNGVEEVSIEIDMHISEGNEILIESVTVLLDYKDIGKQEYVKSLIKDKFGIICQTEVRYENENQ